MFRLLPENVSSTLPMSVLSVCQPAWTPEREGGRVGGGEGIRSLPSFFLFVVLYYISAVLWALIRPVMGATPWQSSRDFWACGQFQHS